MNCPKCGNRLTEHNDISRSSSLTGQMSSQGTVNGFSCIICGKWLDIVPTVVRAHPARVGREITWRDRIYTVSSTDRIVWKFRDSIRQIMKQETDVKSIIRLLRLAKASDHQIRPKSLLASIDRLNDGKLERYLGGDNEHCGTQEV